MSAPIALCAYGSFSQHGHSQHRIMRLLRIASVCAHRKNPASCGGCGQCWLFLVSTFALDPDPHACACMCRSACLPQAGRCTMGAAGT